MAPAGYERPASAFSASFETKEAIMAVENLLSNAFA
jgi:hypothetical protein